MIAHQLDWTISRTARPTTVLMAPTMTPGTHVLSNCGVDIGPWTSVITPITDDTLIRVATKVAPMRINQVRGPLSASGKWAVGPAVATIRLAAAAAVACMATLKTIFTGATRRIASTMTQARARTTTVVTGFI